MGNQYDEEDDVQSKTDESSNGRNESKGLLLDYTMKAVIGAAIFSVHKVSPQVVNFLKRIDSYVAENGLRIKLGAAFNEWKDSTNTVYLNDKVLDRPDITMFACNSRKAYPTTAIRDNKIAMFNAALKEFIGVVSNYYKDEVLESKLKNDGRVKLS